MVDRVPALAQPHVHPLLPHCGAQQSHPACSLSPPGRRFAQRVAMVRNEVSVNEEVDPHAIIRRLRLEVR